MQEDLQKLPPGFPRGAVPQPSFPPLAPVMGPMHTLMPTQSLQPTQQLEYKAWTLPLLSLCDYSLFVRSHLPLKLMLFCGGPSGAVPLTATNPAAA